MAALAGPSGSLCGCLRATCRPLVHLLLVFSLSVTCLHASSKPLDVSGQAARRYRLPDITTSAESFPAADELTRRVLDSDSEFNLTEYVPHAMRIAPINPAFQTENASELEAAAANRSGEAGGSSYGPLSKQIRFGGPVMIGNPFIEVFVIFYGAWANVVEKNIILTFIKSLDRRAPGNVKDWWAVVANYKGYLLTHVSDRVRVAGTVHDRYSLGPILGDPIVQALVLKHTGPGRAFPWRTQGIYLVVSDRTVGYPGLCSQWCGYHDYFFAPSSFPLVYSYVGHAGRCLLAQCSTKGSFIGPNIAPGLDDTISTIAHELAEAATDPYPPFGYSSITGQENGDVCAWKYKRKKTNLLTGITHNMVGKSRRKFFIQSMYDNRLMMCVNSARKRLK